MKRRFLFVLLAVVGIAASAQQTNVEVKTGVFDPDWNSLSQWKCPEWFMDAKFGIWAHWGPQCHAEAGDWYARFMYYSGSGQYNWHVSHFGNPANFGLKELCNDWKAQNWDPERLINLYKSVGARYFMALGNHHDNFDLWESPYQEWNSVNMGPKKDLLKGWSEACKKAGLPLGVSMHASHAWTWLEPSQWYDGNLTKEDGYKLNADGTEKWWKGYDPQELYAQNHSHSSGWENSGTIHSQWEWGNGASQPSSAYKQKFQNRILQCIDDYQPDMIYFDDTAMPFYGCDDNVGKNILAHYYNSSAAQHDGTPQVVVTGKQLNADQKNYMLWDVERGIPDRMQEKYWQTCTCLGSWHYDQAVYNNNGYKSAATVIRMLIDIVSKNGNLLLSVPVRSDGTIDAKEEAILADIKAWMDINGESIYGTRTWKTFGEGPLAEASNPMNAQGFNEGQSYSARDVRYVQKAGKVYATIMAWPNAGTFTFESFSIMSEYYSGKVNSVELLGHGAVDYLQSTEGLIVTLPAVHPNEIAPVFVITTEEVAQSGYEGLQAVIEAVDAYLVKAEGEANFVNTGKPSAISLSALRETVVSAKEVGNTATDEELAAAQEQLLEAYQDFKKNGMNKGGKFEGSYAEDLTLKHLVEASAFSRSEGGSQRFGKPKNWTVENFKIPNGGDGTKQGLDRYSGNEALMLGVWNDAGNNQTGDLSNARIYRKIHLEAGKYYFGAGYNTHYSISPDAYMFVSSALYDTDELPEKCIACYPIMEVTEDKTLCGLYFEIAEEMDLYIGFQADLSGGSATQEFRAEKVALYLLPDTNLDKLLDEIQAKLDEHAPYVGNNTGHYEREAWQIMTDKCAAWKTLLGTLTPDEELTLFYEAENAWNHYLATAYVKGTTFDATDAVDITKEYLIETDHFTRSKGGNDRFGTPLYWTVENYNIQSNTEGLRGGLDKWPGHDHLTLGVWDDKQKAPATSDITNARVYRRVTLNAGDYFFGATYETIAGMDVAYVFASTTTLSTADIPTKAIAFMPIAECVSGSEYWGIRFTLPVAQEVLLGWQVDLLNSPARQEFRAAKVMLAAYGIDTEIDIIDICTDNIPSAIYTIEGIRLGGSVDDLPKGLYIIGGKKVCVE